MEDGKIILRAIIGKAQIALKRLLAETQMLKAILLRVQKKVRSMVEMASVFMENIFIFINYIIFIY